MANRIYYTLLNVDQREEVEAYLHERAWLEPSESIRQLGRAGAGNMNLTLRVDTGCLVAFSESVDYDIQFQGGFKNALFGGEGLFLAKVEGPGKVFLQSLPFSRLADRVMANVGSRGKGEGSILGGIGNLLDGD